MTVESEKWELLQTLFHLAAETPEVDRERVLAEACSDPDLRSQAIAIAGAGDVDFDEPEPQGPPVLTGRIGPYVLQRLVGSGGIGSVYLVERTVNGTPLRSAMKVLAPNAAGPAFVERFHREQEILAKLDHPNITRMLDAGLTDTDAPYIVMEYVEGTHLDAYCDSNKLGIPERLELFLKVCHAVAYAHRNLVVHLDLKPSNILVTNDGIVKLLDFGTSKLIEADSMLTTTVMATPAYASPEQMRNDPVTTACDIYSLGVVLFELLSGRRPGGKASVAAIMERAITEREPERLTSSVSAEAAERRGLTTQRLLQALRGDLATIVAKCLRPRPADRYSSLDLVAEDIQRSLDGRPVLARSQTTIYLLGKFIRRNRRAALAALITAIVLVASLAYAEWRQQQAIEEGQRALRMQTFLYRLLYLANSNYTGKPTFTVADFLELGVKLLPDYIKDPADLRKAQMSLAESMYENNDLENAHKVFAQVIASAKAAGDVDTEAESEANSGEVSYLLGNTEEGLALTTRSLELSRQGRVSPSVRVWSEVYYATNRDRLGFRTDETLRLLQNAARQSTEHNVLPPRETADVLYSLGWDLKLRDRMNEAEPVYQQALAIYAQDPQAKCDQSAVYGELAYIKDSEGDVQASLPIYQRAYDGLVSCSGADNRGALEQQARLAGALTKAGRAKESVVMLEQAMPAWRKIAGSSPDLGEPLQYLARAYLATGRDAEAERTAKELFDVQNGKVSPTDRRIGMAQLVWAQALSDQHRYSEALPHAVAATALLTHGNSVDARHIDAEAHGILLEIQSRLR